MSDFCHLHCHTQYSLLDGAAGIDTLLDRAKQKQIPAVAITDHGNLYGVPEFYTTAKKKGVQPIIGCEFYVTPSGIDDQKDRTRYHQVLLAKNETGYENLMKLSSTSFLDGFYYKPRIDHDLIAEHSEGLVATTCCLQGEVLQTILHRGEEQAREIFEWYLNVFGDDYYIEIQDHDIDDQHTCNEVLLQWAKEYDVEVVATNDVHYVEQDDAAAQDVLLCLQTGKDYNDPNRMRFENDQFYLKGAEEMTEALTGIPSDFQREALVTTTEIAGKCDFELPMGDLLMPHYPIPDRFDGMDDYLRHLTFERAKERYGDPLSQDVVDRLNHELGIIKEMGYSGYFLIVQDFTEAARELDVRVGPGRGSAAGSCVSYCLGITNVDPLQYDLLFERFLNPERVSMPDIDIDFDDRGRSKVIDYVVQKYGRENVCQIITFGTMGAKTAIRDVARVLDIPLDEADRIAKMIPDGVGVDLDQAKDEVPEFRNLKRHDDPQVRKMMHYAEVLEGSARHTGVHAAGVIIAPGQVSEYVPVSVSKSKGEKVMTTQYDGDWVEEFGLLKMDFLGLKTLTVINDALELIEENHGVTIDIEEIPFDDEATYELFQRGETVSIFQFESTGMREWMRKLKPTELDDLIAMNALYRPGPMENIPTYIARKHGEEPVEYPHPMLEDILEPTYGIPVYQEQVMQIAQQMGGFSLGKADILRRCVTGDTLVVDAATGERVRVDQVEPGMSILTMDDRYGLTKTTVTERFHNGRKPVYRVTTRSGRTIKLTANHPLRTVGGWKHLSELSEGDAIAVPATLPAHGTDMPDSARVTALAYLLGDGQTMDSQGRAVARFYNSDPALLADYEAAVASLGGQAKRYEHPTSSVQTITARGAERGHNPITALVRETDLVGRAEEKQFPKEVFRYDADSLALFLGRLFSTDGSVEKTRLSYNSSSPALIDDLAHALLRLGIPTVRRHRTTTHRDNQELIITDQKDIVRFADEIGPHVVGAKQDALAVLRAKALARQRSHSIYNVPAAVTHAVRRAKYASGRSWREGGEQVGMPGNTLSSGLNFKTPTRKLSRHRLEALGRAFDSPELIDMAAGDVLWDPIVDIEPAGDAEVYDLAVPPHANFLASDVVIHNSMGKKKVKIMNRMKGQFVEGARAQGVDDATIEHVWELMAKFAGYGFNKSHAAAYSIVAYQTAFLKAHYPAEFMAAAMTNDMGNNDKLSVVLEEARTMGLEILPPSINRSAANFTVDDGAIRFGLAAVKGAGTSAIDEIVATREAHGPFETIWGVTKHLDLRTAGKRTLESLAQAGAMDDLEGHRAQLIDAVDDAVHYGQKVQADKAAGQNSLFGNGEIGSAEMEPNLPRTEPWPKSKKLKAEHEVIGFYVSGHPLDEYRAEAEAFANAHFGDTEQLEKLENVGGDGYGRDRGPVRSFCGILTEVKRHTTKSGKPIAFAEIEDFTGQGELVCFANVLDRIQAYLEVDEVVLVRGNVEVRGGVVKVIVKDVFPMWKVRDQMVQSMVLTVNPDRIQPDHLQQFKSLCEEHPGHCKLYFDVDAGNGPKQRVRSRKMVVDPTADFMKETQRLFGLDNIMLQGEA
ncbi:MAG: DNA polymerase III subunit alpha [Bacteroidetes bacterium]|jgi:DNA polymerase-3 subunit alpha|nr:DNA polymerase III subunit alpha [Bacteroidota bacterium]